MSSALVVTTARGIAPFLEQELNEFNIPFTSDSPGVCRLESKLEHAYQVCMHSRIAHHVLWQLADFPAVSPDDIYDGLSKISWFKHFDANKTFSIDINVDMKKVKDNTQFILFRVKDAIVDSFRKFGHERPNVERNHPDITVSVFWNGETATAYLDLSGGALDKRGYRKAQGDAPIRETLAAGLLYAAGWDKAEQNSNLIDPFCGSGTILIEGMLMAYNIAPGLLRRRFGFEKWKQHQQDTWKSVKSKASKARLDNKQEKLFNIRGFDSDPKAMSNTKENAERLGLGHLLHVEKSDISQLHKRAQVKDNVFCVTNPPYGERLEEQETIFALYQFIAKQFSRTFEGQRCAIISDHIEKLDTLGLQDPSTHKVRNGNLNCYMRAGTVKAATPYNMFLPLLNDGEIEQDKIAQDFANRLKKNYKKLKKWLDKEQIDCFRLYDADLPDYKLAIDWYHGFWHVQEYAAPKSVDPQKAQQRLEIALETLCQIFKTGKRYVYLKTRQQQKGKAQYNVQSERDKWLEVNEHGANLHINLSRYLDTGLFLDHRPVRSWIQAEAANKRLLNLFCYTGSVTVQAAMGGAKSSVSVDTSNTYLQWAQRNLLANGLSPENHKLVRKNCVDFLYQDKGQYDLIFIDPPTFSNSKSRHNVFDIQKDHTEIIELAMKRLEPGGTVYFSTNSRKFKLDESLTTKFNIQDVTQASIPLDFDKKPPIHYCWKIGFK